MFFNILHVQVSGMTKPLFLIHFVIDNMRTEVLVWVVEAVYTCIS